MRNVALAAHPMAPWLRGAIATPGCPPGRVHVDLSHAGHHLGHRRHPAPPACRFLGHRGAVRPRSGGHPHRHQPDLLPYSTPSRTCWTGQSCAHLRVLGLAKHAGGTPEGPILSRPPHSIPERLPMTTSRIDTRRDLRLTGVWPPCTGPATGPDSASDPVCSDDLCLAVRRTYSPPAAWRKRLRLPNRSSTRCHRLGVGSGPTSNRYAVTGLDRTGWRGFRRQVHRGTPLHIGRRRRRSGQRTPRTVDRLQDPLGGRSNCATTCSASTATTQETGKPAGDDLREGKRTALVAIAWDAPTHSA